MSADEHELTTMSADEHELTTMSADEHELTTMSADDYEKIFAVDVVTLHASPTSVMGLNDPNKLGFLGIMLVMVTLLIASMPCRRGVHNATEASIARQNHTPPAVDEETSRSTKIAQCEKQARRRQKKLESNIKNLEKQHAIDDEICAKTSAQAILEANEENVRQVKRLHAEHTSKQLIIQLQETKHQQLLSAATQSKEEHEAHREKMRYAKKELENSIKMQANDIEVAHKKRVDKIKQVEDQQRRNDAKELVRLRKELERAASAAETKENLIAAQEAEIVAKEVLKLRKEVEEANAQSESQLSDALSHAKQDSEEALQRLRKSLAEQYTQNAHDNAKKLKSERENAIKTLSVVEVEAIQQRTKLQDTASLVLETLQNENKKKLKELEENNAAEERKLQHKLERAMQQSILQDQAKKDAIASSHAQKMKQLEENTQRVLDLQQEATNAATADLIALQTDQLKQQQKIDAKERKKGENKLHEAKEEVQDCMAHVRAQNKAAAESAVQCQKETELAQRKIVQLKQETQQLDKERKEIQREQKETHRLEEAKIKAENDKQQAARRQLETEKRAETQLHDTQRQKRDDARAEEEAIKLRKEIEASHQKRVSHLIKISSDIKAKHKQKKHLESELAMHQVPKPGEDAAKHKAETSHKLREQQREIKLAHNKFFEDVLNAMVHDRKSNEIACVHLHMMLRALTEKSYVLKYSPTQDIFKMDQAAVKYVQTRFSTNPDDLIEEFATPISCLLYFLDTVVTNRKLHREARGSLNFHLAILEVLVCTNIEGMLLQESDPGKSEFTEEWTAFSQHLQDHNMTKEERHRCSVFFKAVRAQDDTAITDMHVNLEKLQAETDTCQPMTLQRKHNVVMVLLRIIYLFSTPLSTH